MAKLAGLLALAIICMSTLASASDEPPQVPSGELALSLYAKDSANFELLKNKQVAYALTNAAGKN